MLFVCNHRAMRPTPTFQLRIQEFWRGGGRRQFISPVVIYRKCTQRNIKCLLRGNRQLFDKKMLSQQRGAPAESVTASFTRSLLAFLLLIFFFVKTRLLASTTVLLLGLLFGVYYNVWCTDGIGANYVECDMTHCGWTVTSCHFVRGTAWPPVTLIGKGGVWRRLGVGCWVRESGEG